ncbi:MAG TPA: MATE family efflux transporter, partial [Candidatus Limnocylindria bacterium]|nr:MATE family efflux transporter [Candidatus Limnocylindria bacterium]
MIRDKGFYRALAALAIPAAFQSLVNILMATADNLMVSRVDARGLAFTAVLQSGGVVNLALAALTGLSAGSVVLVSQYWGIKDYRRIREAGAASLAICALAAVLLIGLVNLFPRAILGIVIRSDQEEAISYAMRYLPLASLSFLPYAVTAALTGLMRGVQVARVTIYAGAVSLISKVGLSYLLVFGGAGFQGMGVPGAALATLLSRLLEMAAVILFCLKGQRTLPLGRGFVRAQAAWAWRDFARYAMPVGLTDMQWSVIGIVKLAIIGQLGSTMTNAAGVSETLMNLATLVPFALAGGAAVLVGKAVGSGDVALARSYSRTLQALFLGLGLTVAALAFLLRGPFIGMHAMTPEAASLASRMIVLGSITLIGTGYHASCFMGILRGAGDSRFVMLVDLICGWLIVIPSAALA